MEYVMMVLLSFLVAALFSHGMIWISKKYALFDRNEIRTGAHHRSRLGGVGLFLSFFTMYIFLTCNLGEPDNQPFVVAVWLLFVLGVSDDIFNIKAGIKLMVQIGIAAYVVYDGSVNYLTSIFDSITWNAIAGNIFSVMLLVYVINAFNLIDGIDGLAATLAAVINLILAIFFALFHDPLFTGMSFVLFGTLSGFLLFNTSPAKVFMGDSGSMVIGFISVVMAFRFIELNREVFHSIYTSSVIMMALFIVPLYDTLRVFVIRLKMKRSPFKGDQNHVHHRMRRLGLTDHQIVYLLVFYTLFVFALTFLLRDLGDFLLCALLLMVSMLFNTLLDYRLKKTVIKKS